MTSLWYSPVSLRKSDRSKYDFILMVEEEVRPTWFGRIFGYKSTVSKVEFVGSGTVWYRLPHFERADIGLSLLLIRYYDKLTYYQGEPK